MSRLDDLYKAIETMRREHLSTADLEAKVSLAEEEIIKNEILPVLKQNIEPALQPVKRELGEDRGQSPALPYDALTLRNG